MKKRRMKRRPVAAQKAVEYVFRNTPWKIVDLAGLTEDIGVKADELAEFHAAAGEHSLSFSFARMIYGIGPVIPEPGSDPDMMRAFTREEVAAKFGTTVEGVDGQLEILATAWRRITDSREKPAEPKVEPELIPPPKPVEMLSIADEQDVLGKYGFARSMFDLPGRSDDERQAESQWFIGRIVELRKMFDEPMAKSLARQAVLNELTMRRCDDASVTTPITSAKFAQIQDLKERVERTYREQWSQLEEVVPFIKAMAGKQTFAGVVSDLVEAWRQYKANGNNKLIDGVFTAFEIAIEMRHSVQAEVRYRPGLTSAINEARQGLFDPAWRRSLPNSVIASMDKGFREAFHKSVEESGMPVVDLEKEGPGSEYPNLPEPEQFEEQVALPDENVKLEG